MSRWREAAILAAALRTTPKRSLPAMHQLALAVAVFGFVIPQAMTARPTRPEDLFRFQRIGAIAWSPDGTRAAVEIHQPSQWLTPRIPTAEIAIVDASLAQLRAVTSASRDVVGFFGPSWSSDSHSLVFFSVDAQATVEAWLWSGGTPRRLDGMILADNPVDPPRALWSDAEHVVLRLRDPAARNEGPLYFALQRGRNVADDWQRARVGQEAAVSVFNAQGGHATTIKPPARARLVSVNVNTGKSVTLAAGAIHAPRISADGRTVTYREESPAVTDAAVATFFGPGAHGEAVYDPVNWGTVTRHVDARTGETVPAPATTQEPTAARADRPALRVGNDAAVGTTLWLRRPGRPDVSVWTGNTWIREIATGRVQPVQYRATTGARLTGWLLYPPGHVPGQKLPIVMIVYPGTVYTERQPSSFDIFNVNFKHPQLFAALGYAVALPSMPASENPLQTNALDALMVGVIPFLDALVGRGIADPRRIAVVGQSAGGWATLGLIGRTDRFRTAIASASYANLVSLYGTFYGQYRYGDAGDPQRAQLLRMLQFERGYYGAGAPPWEQPERYRINSPLWSVGKVKTPLLLVHGDQDFVPVQQAEEFFTALYRQDKRAQLVRYSGEEHTIAARQNVLDMWKRFESWLRETMPRD